MPAGQKGVALSSVGRRNGGAQTRPHGWRDLSTEYRAANEATLCASYGMVCWVPRGHHRPRPVAVYFYTDLIKHHPHTLDLATARPS